ncbi:MAG: protocatechuate 3,4-dioxygenase subunit beta, partial [Chloroflexi bacterium]
MAGPAHRVRTQVHTAGAGDPASRPGTGYTLGGVEDHEPPYLHPDYRATVLRAPAHQPVRLADEWFHRAPGPAFGRIGVRPEDADLTRQHAGEPLGERIILTGRVTDSDGRPVRNTLVEIWQANAAGRYVDPADDHPAPLDPNFTGAGRCLTDDEGAYRFVTV